MKNWWIIYWSRDLGKDESNRNSVISPAMSSLKVFCFCVSLIMKAHQCPGVPRVRSRWLFWSPLWWNVSFLGCSFPFLRNEKAGCARFFNLDQLWQDWARDRKKEWPSSVQSWGRRGVVPFLSIRLLGITTRGYYLQIINPALPYTYTLLCSRDCIVGVRGRNRSCFRMGSRQYNGNIVMQRAGRGMRLNSFCCHHRLIVCLPYSKSQPSPNLSFFVLADFWSKTLGEWTDRHGSDGILEIVAGSEGIGFCWEKFRMPNYDSLPISQIWC